ncbi:hypothetical protein ACQ4LE_005742 [Meloidogyne hapla]|uniref:Uncharacterized protein n=1 Tax=Meloidogyne hapla TaxID=6305 RepID=A0A1I8B4N2_MELHA
MNILFPFILLIFASEFLDFSNSAIVRRESSVQVQPVNNNKVTDPENSLPKKPKPECKMQCRPAPSKRGRECYIECHGELPSTVRIAPILDQKCAEKCNGGPVVDYSNFKRECAIKCAIPE